MKKQQTPHPNPALQKHARKSLKLFLTIVVLSIVFIAGIVAIVVVPGYFGGSKPALQELAAVLKVHDPAQEQITFMSQLGFSGHYNGQFLQGHGQVTTGLKDGVVSGQEYADSEMSVARSYSIVKLQLKSETSSKDPLGLITRPELVILTSARDKYFEARHSKFPGLNDTEITVREFTPTDGVLVSREQETINGTAYQKLLYSFTGGGGTVIAYDLQYVTVQNNRPYSISLHYYPSTKEGDLTTLVQALHSIIFAPPAADAQYLAGQGPEPKPTAMVAGAKIVLASSTVNTPDTLKSGTELSVVAKNQLAVVRVGTIYCYDVTLLIRGQEGRIPAACNAGSGSGSIVGKDGAVSTNGHVALIPLNSALQTEMMILVHGEQDAKLSQYVNYFAKAGVITQTQADDLVRGMKAADLKSFEAWTSLLSQASAHVNGITTSYAVQLSNNPIKLNFVGDKLTFDYTDTVVKATFVDANFDLANEESSDIASIKSSDVALLTLDKKSTYPVVKLGSMDGVKPGSELTILGFPGFVDGGLSPTKPRTIPTATQGEVTDGGNDAGGHLVIATSAPIAEGNSGGPAFDTDGKQIGLVTYAALSASDPEVAKTKFSDVSFVRDVADFIALAKTHSMTFDGSSSVSSDWVAAIDAFAKGDYRAALDGFKKVDAAYGNNYLVKNFINASSEHVTSTTGESTALGVLVGVVVVVGVAIVVVIVTLVKHRSTPPMVPPQYPTVSLPPLPPTLPLAQ